MNQKSKWELRIFIFIVAIIILFAINKTARGQGLTFTTNSYPAGSSIYGVAAADLNGDGKPDIVADCTDNGTLVILTNNGNGQFGSNSVVSGSVPSYTPYDFVACADVNGDGKTDLIWATLNSPEFLVIATNNGTSVFTPYSTVKVGAGEGFFAITAADINGDNKVDLICANAVDSKVYVVTNNGSGIFGAYATLTVGAYPTSVAVGDFNGDGRPDIVSANSGEYPSSGNTLTVYTNNGTGFGLKATLTVGTYPYSVVVADVNGDGSPDLISANNGPGTLTVLTNDGHGNFSLNATILDGGAYSVVAADLNGDGNVDLACANSVNKTVTIFTNNGSGIFGSNTTLIASSISGAYTDWLVTTDVNGDGQMDLIAGNQYRGDDMVVFTQTSIGSPKLSLTITNSTALRVSWSTPSTTFVLQTNSSLLGTNWAEANYPISTNGQNRNMVISPRPVANLYFRLKQQPN